MELWDAYDADYNKIEGITLVRGEEASFHDGIFHFWDYAYINCSKSSLGCRISISEDSFTYGAIAMKELC